MHDTLTEFGQLLVDANAEALSGSTALEPPERQPMLNGLPYRTFRQSVSIDDRRKAGTFFSGPELSRELAVRLASVVPAGSLVLDPTCGIGDLLLAFADTLSLESDLMQTLDAWGEQLGGIERRQDLVDMTKSRLIALARSRGGFREQITTLEGLFPQIVAGDMFHEKDRIQKAAGILFNPPFGRTRDHDTKEWGTGMMSAAAIFLDAIVDARAPKAPIAAVLPEVLRCGSRYARFRSRLIEANIKADFNSRGRFDAWTDVDVFTTLLTTGAGPLWTSPTPVDETIGDHFTVRTGPVVPHRHQNKGKWHRFICAKSVPAWSENFLPEANRRFAGTLYSPPFVVIRRTSSPSDRKRAVGAIIAGDRPVAVENHLIVLLPKEGGREMCVKLLSVLNSDTTTAHLNDTIRCRHLTNSSVMAIPWTSNL